MKRIVTFAAGALALAVAAVPALAQTAAAPASGGAKIGVIEVQRIVQSPRSARASPASSSSRRSRRPPSVRRSGTSRRDPGPGQGPVRDAMEAQKEYQAKAVELKR